MGQTPLIEAVGSLTNLPGSRSRTSLYFAALVHPEHRDLNVAKRRPAGRGAGMRRVISPGAPYETKAPLESVGLFVYI